MSIYRLREDLLVMQQKIKKTAPPGEKEDQRYIRNAKCNLIDDIVGMIDQIMEDKIEVTWSVKDVQSVRPDLSEEDAGDVLLLVREEHDANVGINWNFIEFIASNLFPEK